VKSGRGVRSHFGGEVMKQAFRTWTVLFLGLAWAVCGAAMAAEEFLPPEQAFRYTVESDGDSLTVRWTVAPGYYLYRSRMGLSSATPGITIGTPSYPEGEVHRDDYFGEQVIFRDEFTVTAPLERAADAPRELALELRLQGCADAGLCYPPMTWDTKVALPPASAANAASILELARRASNEDEFLPPDEAFRLEAVAAGPDRVRLVWTIADGYYLYRSKLAVSSEAENVQLGQLSLPAGKTKTDEYFGTQEVYYGELEATLPVARAATEALELPLAVTYQGCADAGLCYPPITKTVSVSLPPGTGAGGFVSEQDRLAALIREGNPFLVLATFFGLGLLLAFTPCVLPMVPILSGIIAGHGTRVTTRRAFALSLTYVLGMAFTYTLAGALFAAAGRQVQAVFQQPWIVTLFAGLFVVLALSMFGLFNIQMPAAIQTRLANLSNRQSAGHFGGVAVMGALSALIVTTCVAPPLVATLAVIGQSGDMVRGGAALFAMSLGMGTPLLAVGASAGKLLPRVGPWMEVVKRSFGVLMLAVAAWMLARIVPESLTLLLWAVPAFCAAWVLWTAVKRTSKTAFALRTTGAAAGLYGVVLVAGAALGGSDPLAPLPMMRGQHSELPFTTIKSVSDLEQQLAAARASGRPLMLDFYADWCVSCKEMERYTFTDEAVHEALAGAVLLRADVTRNDAEDQALLKHFGIFGPPTIVFYGPDGTERRNYRVVGYMKAPEFAALAREALARETLVAR
jgi:Thiol:disulfide interchange protein